MPFQNTIFRPGPDKKEQHNNHSPINLPSKDFRNEDKGPQTSTTDRQGSASPPSGPLREGSSEVTLGNGSAQEQHKEHQQTSMEVHIDQKMARKLHQGKSKAVVLLKWRIETSRMMIQALQAFQKIILLQNSVKTKNKTSL